MNNINTKRLSLEPIKPCHAKLLFKCLQATELYTFIPLDPPLTIERLESKYKKWEKGGSDDGNEIWLNYAVYHNELKVYVGTLQATIQIGGVVYIAYEIFPKYWKRGLAKEACEGMLENITLNYNVNEFIAHADTRNEASIALLKSLKFIKKETIYNADHFKGASSDEFVYTLTISN